MKKWMTIILCALLLTGCGLRSTSDKGYTSISQEEASQIMNEEVGYIILDVRTIAEYQEGHIPNAICIPNEDINDTPPPELIDFDQLILVYCRSGNRSKQAAQKLADMGYTYVVEFGGINTWKGEIVAY